MTVYTFRKLLESICSLYSFMLGVALDAWNH